MSNKISIRRLLTCIPGLDSLLGGGIPECSFNLIASTPGCGKTTLAHQIMFSQASPNNRALFFTVLGESIMNWDRIEGNWKQFKGMACQVQLVTAISMGRSIEILPIKPAYDSHRCA